MGGVVPRQLHSWTQPPRPCRAQNTMELCSSFAETKRSTEDSLIKQSLAPAILELLLRFFHICKKLLRFRDSRRHGRGSPADQAKPSYGRDFPSYERGSPVGRA